MKEKAPIIAFAPHAWDQPQWMNRQHLLSRLGERGWPVIYNTGALSVWQRESTLWKNSPIFDKFTYMDSINVHFAGKFSPRWPKIPKLEKLSISFYCHLIKKLTKQRPDQSITLLFHPDFFPYAKCLKSKYLALHVYDTYSGMANWTSKREEMLIETIKRANLITAASESMARSLPYEGFQKTKILHNGVDPAPFISDSEYQCPDDLKNIPYPRIANLGTINLKMDMKTISHIAAVRPNWHWIFVGRLEEEELNSDQEAREALKVCRQLNNVHFLGEKPRSMIPNYAHNVDVNTICYRIRKDDWVISGYPLKLNEYLAVGKPIVASPQTAICEHFSEVVDIARTPDEWVSSIDRALVDGGVSNPQRRREVALSNTWDKRVDLLENWLSEMINS